MPDDAALVLMLAENVMGWETKRHVFRTPSRTFLAGWNPIVAITDAFMLVDTLRARGLHFSMAQDVDDSWVVDFHRPGDLSHKGPLARDKDRLRAICLGALRAIREAE